MIYPIYLYGSSVLRKKGVDLRPDHENLKQLIDDMFETMYDANGLGLAAPQIGKNLNLFIVDLTEWEDDDEGIFSANGDNSKRVFINSEIYERDGEPVKFTEGCLSLPGINEDVLREPSIKIRYMDENFEQHDREFDGIWARVIQHEYDHTQGVLFTDNVAPLRRNLLRSKLQKLSKGIHEANYRCKLGR